MQLQESLLVSSIANEELSDDLKNDHDNENNEINIVEKINETESNNKPTNISPDVVIHVCDESRNLEKSFECNRQLLIDKMSYFKQYLNIDDQEEDEEVDISVHCDILVFEWLIQYISHTTKPKLEIHNVVSILISSNFLQMSVLVDECIHFMCENLNDIIELPLDLSCLSDEIVTKLSNKLNILTIDLLNDPTDKIMSRLYRYHLEIFIKQKENKLFFCVYCGELYTKEQRKKLICYRSPVYINFHGQVIRKHSAQTGWNVSKYLLGLRLQNYSWKSIYWHLFAVTRAPLFCYECDKYITIPKLYHCTYHTKQPVNKGLNTLFYACCETTENNFEIMQDEKKGCSNKQHQIINDNSNQETQEIINIISAHAEYIFIPFECSNLCSLTTSNKGFIERPQSADHRSRLLKHSHHKIKKRFSLNSPPKKTGVWDKQYFIFGSQSLAKAMNGHHLNNNNSLNFDSYHNPISFWHYENNENRNNNNDNITEDSCEYLSYLLIFDNIDYEGESDSDIKQIVDEEDDDDGSVNMEDAHDVMCLHSNSQTAQVVMIDDTHSPKNNNKKKCNKPIPIRGRRLKGMTNKNRFSVDVKQTPTNKSSSAFGIQQNDIRRLDALMKSLSQNRQS